MKLKFRNGVVIGCIAAALGSGYVVRHDIRFTNTIYKEKPVTSLQESSYIYFTGRPRSLQKVASMLVIP